MSEYVGALLHYLISYIVSCLIHLNLDSIFGVQAFCNPEYDKYQKWTNFDGPYSMGRRCIAGRHVHQYTFDYVEQVFAVCSLATP
jgi:hypothetical protein